MDDSFLRKQKRELGERGRNYVCEMLLQGRLLSSLIKSRTLGNVYVVGSFDLSEANLENLQSGGTGIAGLAEAIVPLILEHLKRRSNNLVIVDDHILRRTDPVLRSRHYVVFRDSICQFCDNADPEEVCKLVRKVSAYPTIMLLTSSNRRLEASQEVSEKQVEDLVAAAELLLVGAWDEEGFVAADFV
jgi:hypothetical protein